MAPLLPPPAPPSTALAPHASTWSETTRSPHVGVPLEDAQEAEVAAACGTLDAALMRAAHILKDDELEPILRELGSPAVRARVIVGHGKDNDVALKKLLESKRTANTRCGVAKTDEGIVVVSAELLADLDPLPVRARTGAWLELSATLHVPAASAKVIVLGPRGVPKTVPTSIDQRTGKTHARFALDRPGAFTVQLLGDVAGGPRPLLEARVFADVLPSSGAAVAPGENETSLERMVAVVRNEEALPKLKRDPRLDALAAAHAEHMRSAGIVAHDLGDGDLAQRFEAEGLVATTVGENVARADSLSLAHRALYASPSHRLNLLNAQYTRIGLATTEDKGRVYACEVFSSELR